jgi:hypothetical protein
MKYRCADWLASCDQGVILMVQESMYFFAVLFLIDLKLWPLLWLKYVLATAVLVLSLVRTAYYASLSFLRRAVALLSAEKKLCVLTAHERKDALPIETILSNDLGLMSATEVTRYLLRTDRRVVAQKLLRVQ